MSVRKTSARNRKVVLEARGDDRQPDTCFILTAPGIDHRVGAIVLWCVRLTWFRYTRLTGQALARVLSVPFMLLAVANGCVTYGIPFHPNWFGMAFQIGWISFMIHQVHTNSHRLEPLNSTSPPLMVAVYAVRMKVSRIMWLVALLIVTPLALLPGGFSLLFIVGELIVLLAIE